MIHQLAEDMTAAKCQNSSALMLLFLLKYAVINLHASGISLFFNDFMRLKTPEKFFFLINGSNFAIVGDISL
jgi:hypothetical protein